MNKCFKEKDTIKLYKNKEYNVFECIESKENFISKHVSNYRTYYVDDEHLLERIQKIKKHESKKTDRQIYKELIKTYIPDKENIKAGDFGEIVSSELYCSILKDNDKEINIYNPRKIRWKEDRERAEGKTDVVLIGEKEDQYLIIAVEVKTKSSESTFEPITDMIAGICVDSVSRLGKTIDWIIEKGLQNVEDEELKNIINLKKDYKDMERKKDFKFEHSGVLVIEDDLFKNEINKSLGSIIKVHGNKLRPIKKHLEKLNVKITDTVLEFNDLTENDILKVTTDKNIIKKIIEIYEASKRHMDSFEIKFLLFSQLREYLDDMYNEIVDMGEFNE